ncbi:hypothetical protein Pelo_8578 [Pelomyxa schiedti]|nr:hypothetical protein Pelo_8578 [Pelomyxa schiedti]
MKSKTPELKHVELKEVIVDDKDIKTGQLQALPEFSLIPADHWEKCLAVFSTLPKATSEESADNLVAVKDVKQLWKTEHKGASRFEIDSIASMVELERNNKNGSMMMNPKGFALGCALFPENRSLLPQSCSVKEYINTGFSGSSALSILCDSGGTTTAKWVILLLVNLALSVVSVLYWATWFLGIFTFAIALYLHWFGRSTPLLWKSEGLSGSVLVFSIMGLFDLTVGFAFGIMWLWYSEFWFWFWYCWCMFQAIYMILSTIYIAIVCKLFYGMSHDTVVTVPKYTVFTSDTMAAWISLFLGAFFLGLLIMVGMVAEYWHIVPFCGILTFLCGFVLPPIGILIVMLVKGYPKLMVVLGLGFGALLTLGSVGSLVAFWYWGYWVYPWMD